MVLSTCCMVIVNDEDDDENNFDCDDEANSAFCKSVPSLELCT